MPGAFHVGSTMCRWHIGMVLVPPTSTCASCLEPRTFLGDALEGFVWGKEPGAAAQDGENLWGAPLPKGSTGCPHPPARAGHCGGPRGSRLLPARSDLKAWLCLAAAPVLAVPRAWHKCPSEEKCRERKKYLERQEDGESRRCGREPWNGLKAHSQRGFCSP